MPKTLLYQVLENQATLSKPVSFEGTPAFFDGLAQVTLAPAKGDTGIVFHWRGHSFQAVSEHVQPSGLRTTVLSPSELLEVPESGIFTVEHLLSALGGLGITNCGIHVGDNGMIPFFDGSGHTFCDRILQAGIHVQETHHRQAIYCHESFEVSNGDAWIRVEPPSGQGLRVSATIDFQEPIGKQQLEYIHSPLAYCLNIAWARTFATQPITSAEDVRQALPNFEIAEYKGGSYVESQMVVFDSNGFITTPRRNDEQVRHKVLDFIGDMSLVGFELRADVTMYRPGHALNLALAREVRARYWNSVVAAKPNRSGVFASKYCGDKSRFVTDVTLVDGAAYPPKTALTKTWRVSNDGAVHWKGRKLQRVGPCGGFGFIESPRLVEIGDTAPGETVDVSTEITTPALPGWYLAEWKMIDDDGDLVFPNRYPLFVVLRVEEPAQCPDVN